VVLFCIPPLPSRQDLSNNTSLPPLVIDLLCDFSRLLLLLSIVIEYSAAVLASTVGTLLVGSRRIVHLVEELEEGTVCDFLRVVNDLKRFRICSLN
jgi:hypothetical protein